MTGICKESEHVGKKKKAISGKWEFQDINNA